MPDLTKRHHSDKLSRRMVVADTSRLIPRAVKADKSAGVWAASKQDFTLVVEWVAKDRATHNTIWMQTITADASGSMGSAFSYKSIEANWMAKAFR